MRPSERYRQQAETLEREAGRASSPEYGQELHKLAEGWRALSAEAEKLERAALRDAP